MTLTLASCANLYPAQLSLKDGSRQNRIYYCRGIEHFSRKPRVYVFARNFGKNVFPLYVGQASKRSRIEGQFNNLRLMIGIKNAQAGRLYLKRGQRMGKALDIVKSVLNKNALVQGHDLLNQQGTNESSYYQISG
jgi:hypothetical protein